jgi:anti-sigma regulatory factor (Ser/Thr protein kinase)
LTLKSGRDELGQLYPWFERLSAELALPAKLAFGVQLVLEEAVSNAALHGFDPATPGSVSLSITATSGRLVAVLRDDGRPFDPLSDAPAWVKPTSLEEAAIGGLGIPLMRRYCSDLRYRRAGDENELTMGFDIQPAAADQTATAGEPR